MKPLSSSFFDISHTIDLIQPNDVSLGLSKGPFEYHERAEKSILRHPLKSSSLRVGHPCITGPIIIYNKIKLILIIGFIALAPQVYASDLRQEDSFSGPGLSAARMHTTFPLPLPPIDMRQTKKPSQLSSPSNSNKRRLGQLNISPRALFHQGLRTRSKSQRILPMTENIEIEENDAHSSIRASKASFYGKLTKTRSCDGIESDPAKNSILRFREDTHVSLQINKEKDKDRETKDSFEEELEMKFAALSLKPSQKRTARKKQTLYPLSKVSKNLKGKAATPVHENVKASNPEGGHAGKAGKKLPFSKKLYAQKRGWEPTDSLEIVSNPLMHFHEQWQLKAVEEKKRLALIYATTSTMKTVHKEFLTLKGVP